MRMMRLCSLTVLAFVFSACQDTGMTGAASTRQVEEESRPGKGQSGDGSKNKSKNKIGVDSAKRKHMDKDGPDDNGGGRTKTPDGSTSDGFFPPDSDELSKDRDQGGNTPESGENEGQNRPATGEKDVTGPIKAPRFAMLVNDLKCGMCHTKINGDVASTSDVSDWSSMHVPISRESVSGGWFAARSWTDVAGVLGRYNISVSNGVVQNYVGKMVPNQPGTQQPAFPMIDFVDAETRMSGALTGVDARGAAVKIDKVGDGNFVVIGTDAAPITIVGSVLIKGDLVIKGRYSGLGSIYVTGNIYIPANLQASASVFPYPSDHELAKARGRDLVNARQGDALGLATAKSIFIADLETEIYDRAITPPSQRRSATGIDNVYSWFPGGQAGYQALYEASVVCSSNTLEQNRSFNLIEAYLYAVNSIGGIARRGTWVINGGVITDVLHILGTGAVLDIGGRCASNINPLHSLPQDSNYINYDYRMSAGLRVLGELAPYFQ